MVHSVHFAVDFGAEFFSGLVSGMFGSHIGNRVDSDTSIAASGCICIVVDLDDAFAIGFVVGVC